MHAAAELELSNGINVDDAALYRLLNLRALRRLSLSGCTHISDIGLCALGAKLSSLQELNVSCCHEVSGTRAPWTRV